MTVPLHEIFKTDLDLCLGRDLKRIDSVFPDAGRVCCHTAASSFCNNNSALVTSLSEAKTKVVFRQEHQPYYWPILK